MKPDLVNNLTTCSKYGSLAAINMGGKKCLATREILVWSFGQHAFNMFSATLSPYECTVSYR